MRFITVALLTFSFTCPLFAQAETTTASKPAAKKAPAGWNFFAHYENRMDAIKKVLAERAQPTTQTIVLLGDSITEAHTAHEINGIPAINMGIGGDQIEMTTGGGVLKRVDLVQQAKPTHIFLMIGINDLGSGKSLDKMKEQYTRLVERLRQDNPDAHLHIESVLPTRGAFAHHNANVLEFNKFLQGLAKKNGLDYIDLHSLYKDQNGELKAEVTREGLHLIPKAYDIWTAQLEKAVSAGAEGK
jgi:lysophospholipase L1-like esterase